jgi:hypothetical protein
MTTKERIEHEFSTVEFFGNSGPEDLLDIDFDKSIERWLVPGFNAKAWAEKTGKDADKANIGDILTVTVGKAGPMESQDAMIEIVVLETGRAERSVVAYRYSTASQDDDWQLGTIEQAVEHAAACYDALNEANA